MAGNNTANNLDISDVQTDDLDTLSTRIDSFYTQDSTTKAQLAYHWERNQLMLDGRQWLTYDGDAATGGQWKDLKVTSGNEYLPRPVTNYMFDQYQTLKAYLIKNKPRSKVYPNDPTSHQDRVASEIGTMILEGNWKRLKEDYNYESAAAALVTYGTVFKKSYWDTSSVNLVRVPKMIMKPLLDPMTGAVVGEQEEQETDPITGDDLTEDLPIGDVNTYVIEPYRMTLDPLAMHLHEARWILETSIQSLDWIMETYQKDAPGYTGLAAEVTEETDLNQSLRRWYNLRNQSGTREGSFTSSSSGNGSGSSDVMIDNAAVVKEYYEKPSANYPKGRLVVVANTKVVYAGPSPYGGPEMGDWHPYSECRWELTPGRFWGKSPLDAASELQKRINSIDAVTILTRKTMAVPQWLIPKAAGISTGEITGRPGQEIFYRPDAGAIPMKVPGEHNDPATFQERAQTVSDMQSITGATDILKGQAPQGVGAASAMNLLYELGTGKLYPVSTRWAGFIECDQKKQLRLIGDKYKEPRPDFIRMLKSRNTELVETEINQFIGMDLYDNYNVVIEAGSNIPKLQSAHQAMLLQLAQMGMLNLQNPENRVQFQQDMGIIGYDSDIEPDRKRANWENDLLDNLKSSPNTKPVVFVSDNHDLHLEIHNNRTKSPVFMSLDFDIQQAYMAHIAQHEQMQAQQQQAEMLKQQAMQPSGPSQPAPKGHASQPKHAHGGPATVSPGTPAGVQAGRGKGLPEDAHNAIIGGTDIMNPATLGSSH